METVLGKETKTEYFNSVLIDRVKEAIDKAVELPHWNIPRVIEVMAKVSMMFPERLQLILKDKNQKLYREDVTGLALACATKIEDIFGVNTPDGILKCLNLYDNKPDFPIERPLSAYIYL